MLEKAILIAVKAHRGQVDRGGEAYILHPMRVMLRQKTTEDRICAILHDVVEDTEITFDDLRTEGFSEAVIETLTVLTKLEGEDYEDYIGRIVQNPRACRIKIIDLIDNMDLKRMDSTSEKDVERYKKYEKAKKRVLDALRSNGDLIEEIHLAEVTI